jgi:hypothetical protein
LPAQIEKRPHGWENRRTEREIARTDREIARTDRKTSARSVFSAHGREVRPHRSENHLRETIFRRTESLQAVLHLCAVVERLSVFQIFLFSRNEGNLTTKEQRNEAENIQHSTLKIQRSTRQTIHSRLNVER